MAFAQPAALTRDQVASFESEVDAIRSDVMNRLGGAPGVDADADADTLRALLAATPGCSPMTCAVEQPLAVGLRTEVIG